MSKDFETKRHYSARIILIAGIALSLAIGLLIYTHDAREDSIRFNAQVDQVQSRIRERFERFETFLVQARGFLQSKASISREDFHKYVTDIEVRYEALQGIAIITRVPASGLSKYIQKVRSEGLADYKVWPTQNRDEFYPVTFIEPADWRNKRALGFETFSDPIRRSAMEKARDSGQPTLSAKLTLVQEVSENTQPGFLMFLPLYKAGAKPQSVEARRSELIGFLSCPFRAHDFFQFIFKDQDPSVDFEVFDGTQISPDSLLYDYDQRLHKNHREVRQISIAGHSYTVAFEPLKEPGLPLLPLLISSFGIVIAALLSWIVRSAGLRAEEAKSSSQRAEHEKALLLETSLDAVVGADQENRIIYWNQHSEKIFGWTKDEVLGKDLSNFIIPESKREAHRKGMQRFVSTGITRIQNQRIEIPAIRRSGEEFPIELTVTSIKTATGYNFYSFMRDISEEVKVKETLNNQSKWLESVLNKVQAGVVLVDPKTMDVTFTNDAARRIGRDLSAKSQGRATGYGFIDKAGNWIPKDQWPSARAAQGETIDGQEFTWLTPTGASEFLTFASLLPKLYGHPEAVLVTHLDITELRAREAELRTLANSIPQLAWMAEPDGSIFWYNERWYDYTGTTFDEMEGWGWEKVHHPAVLPKVVAAYSKCVATGEPGSMEFPLRSKNGDYRWFLTRWFPLKDSRNKVLRWFGTNTDIHEQRLARAHSEFLSKASAILNTSLDVEKILKSLSDLCVPEICDWCSIRMMDESGNLKQVAVSHADPEKVKWAWELQKRFPPDPRAPAGPHNVIRTGNAELMNDLNDGSIDAALTSQEQRDLLKTIGMRSYICVPIKNRNAAVGTLSLVCTTESARRYSQEDLQLATELGVRAGISIENAKLYLEAQTLNRLKDEFLATLSHELRTPINVIQGNAEILRNEMRDMRDDIKSAVDAIYRNAQAQTEIVTDLLDVSSIVTGKIPYHPSLLNPVEIISEIVASVQPSAEKKEITLVFDSKNGPDQVFADPIRLHQILWNLVSNALKFTEARGTIKISMSATDHDWSINVRDTGLGIEPDFLPHVFDKFRQEDASITRKYGGLGLGLSIAKKLSEIHGGTIRVVSEGRGKGAEFIVTLPKGQQQQAQRPIAAVEQTPKANTNLNNIRVLIVDDSPDNRVLITRMLKKVGAEVVDAESAAQAREQLKTFQPDVILSDIGMPEENGLDFIRDLRLRAAEKIKNIPAIALTAYVREEEQQAALTAGFNSHVSKPVTADKLVQVITELIRH